MSIHAEVAIEADSFDLGDILNTDDQIEVELTQFLPIGSQLAP